MEKFCKKKESKSVVGLTFTFMNVIKAKRFEIAMCLFLFMSTYSNAYQCLHERALIQTAIGIDFDSFYR